MAIVIQMKLFEENPAVTDFRSRLSDCRTSVAGLLWTPLEPSDAEAELLASLSINEDLAKANPTVSGYRDNVASGHMNLADLARERGGVAEVRDGYERAIALRVRLVEEAPELPIDRTTWPIACAACDSYSAVALPHGSSALGTDAMSKDGAATQCLTA